MSSSFSFSTTASFPSRPVVCNKSPTLEKNHAYAYAYAFATPPKKCLPAARAAASPMAVGRFSSLAIHPFLLLKEESPHLTTQKSSAVPSSRTGKIEAHPVPGLRQGQKRGEDETQKDKRYKSSAKSKSRLENEKEFWQQNPPQNLRAAPFFFSSTKLNRSPLRCLLWYHYRSGTKGKKEEG